MVQLSKTYFLLSEWRFCFRLMVSSQELRHVHCKLPCLAGGWSSLVRGSFTPKHSGLEWGIYSPHISFVLLVRMCVHGSSYPREGERRGWALVLDSLEKVVSQPALLMSAVFLFTFCCCDETPWQKNSIGVWRLYLTYNSKSILWGSQCRGSHSCSHDSL